MPRKLYLMRHGERSDAPPKTFVDMAFDKDGNYTPSDLNHPRILPKRSDGYLAFANDPPLTETGSFTASLVGQGYKKDGVEIHRIYTSPALRCIQTAIGFRNGYEKDIPIHIELGLFEYMTHNVYKNGHPSWMKLKELIAADYPIKTSEQVIAEDELRHGESFKDLYDRSEKVIRALLLRHPGENILCIGHGCTLECCSRLLTGQPYRTQPHFRHVMYHCHYLANFELVEQNDGLFKITGCPTKPLTVFGIKIFEVEVYHMNNEEIEEDIKRKAERFKALW